jgi:hypothetical protein
MSYMSTGLGRASGKQDIPSDFCAGDLSLAGRFAFQKTFNNQDDNLPSASAEQITTFQPLAVLSSRSLPLHNLNATGKQAQQPHPPCTLADSPALSIVPT